ncbi:MAG: STAS domain-containing protein [Candidatus Omnitrophica bacterium]|nr:STAS domain-containing protein [Candidatus Omnitrophota bacterium]
MKVSNLKKSDCTICSIEGEINLNTSPDLRKAFEEFSRQNIKKIIIDFEQVPYIDSSGLATLIELFQRMKKIDGKLRICSVPEKVKNVFEVTKLHKLFEIYDDQESALEGF